MAAVDNLSLDIEQGQLVTLLGPSGCGKTTTLNMIAGFEHADSGDIYIGDRLISGGKDRFLLPPHKRNLGMVFQSYALWPHMTVARNIAYGLTLRRNGRGATRQRVDEALRLVRLEGLAERYPGQLSGGQQRVAFARAIAYNPDVLLLDEPLSNLDATLREEMRVEIRELQSKTGLTTIFVTHDQLEAMTMSDRIVVMNKGRIEQIGSPLEVYENPANRFVAGFVGTTNLLKGKIVSASPDGGLGAVEVAGDKLVCPTGRAKRGDTVLVSIRPESWFISLDEPRNGSEKNLLRSTVEKVIYLGGRREIWLRFGDNQIRTHGYRLPSVEPGQLLYLSAAPEAIRLVAN